MGRLTDDDERLRHPFLAHPVTDFIAGILLGMFIAATFGILVFAILGP